MIVKYIMTNLLTHPYVIGITFFTGNLLTCFITFTLASRQKTKEFQVLANSITDLKFELSERMTKVETELQIRRSYQRQQDIKE